MGKKGVLLDNGKSAQSSMALYWKAAHNKKIPGKGEKKEVPQENMEDRAQSGHDKWKLHKEKMINKMYQKIEKKDKGDDDDEKNKRRIQIEAQLEKDMLERELNKNKPINIPGFKNASQLKNKMQFEQVKVGNNDNNKLIPRGPGEELTHEQIVQILREKKAKKQLARAHKEHVQNNLKEKHKYNDMMMEGIPEDQRYVFKPQKKPEPEPEPVEEKVPQPQSIFKSELLQKIERGQALHKKEQKLPQVQKKQVEQEKQEEPRTIAPATGSRFVPRALRQN